MVDIVFPFNAPAGLEHPEKTSGKTAVSENGGAKSGALGALSTITDERLRELVRAWPTLPETVRDRVIELVRQASGGSK